MKYLILLLSLIVLNTAALAQNNIFAKLDGKRKRADRYYENFDYPNAVQLYLSIYQNDPKDEIALLIAESYRKLNNPAEAANWYHKVINNLILINPEHYLYYAQALLSLQQYDKASAWVEKYKSSTNYDDGVFEKHFKQIEFLQQHGNKVEVDRLNINTPADELCPAIMKNGLLFMSNRKKFSFVKKIDSWTGKAFSELYFAEKLNNKYMSYPQSLKAPKYNQFHLGPVAFYNQGRNVVYTTNNALVNKQDSKTLQIYFSEMSEDEFNSIASFPHNENNFSVGHPAINQEGNFLIFASDMPGGIGGTDLYYCEKINGVWSIPRNFGETINTAGNELFPYLHQDSILYFSSNGKIGIGGLDIFSCKIKNENVIEQPVNPGFPLNTAYDDFGLAIEPNSLEGYFTSNRPGEGGDDIYYFQLQYVPVIVEIPENTSAQIDIYENGHLRNSYANAVHQQIVKLVPGGKYDIEISYNGTSHKIPFHAVDLSLVNRRVNVNISSDSM